jgi:hypothetical protein
VKKKRKRTFFRELDQKDALFLFGFGTVHRLIGVLQKGEKKGDETKKWGKGKHTRTHVAQQTETLSKLGRHHSASSSAIGHVAAESSR